MSVNLSEFVNFKGTLCHVMLTAYTRGNVPALFLCDIEDNAPIAAATVNFADYGYLPPENCCLIRNNGDNQGILEALHSAGIIQPLDKTVTTNGCTAHVCLIIGTVDK